MRSAGLIKFKESLLSILPILLIVILLAVTLVPMTWAEVGLFLVCCVFLVVGMTFFTLGADTAMLPIGQNMGAYLSKSHKIWLMLIFGFILGVVITIAEPDLTVLASQVPGLGNWTIILTVSVGVGIFMMLGVLRTLFKIPLNLILAATYALIFALAFFVPNAFAPLSFDSGSVTTGPISVPLLMGFGLGLAAVRGSNSSSDDSFGLVALGSAGPILAVMILGMFIDPVTLAGANSTVALPESFGAAMLELAQAIPSHLLDVVIIILPIGVLFALFQIFALKLPKQQVIKIFVGLLFVLIGITLFFTGVSVGFLPVGNLIGSSIAGGEYAWLLVPIAGIIGFVIILAEPAVHILAKQVETITEGKISRKTIFLSICIGVAVSLVMCALRVLWQFPIWWFIVPLYIIAIILSFFVPKIFTGIAFDSGGVATGAMSTTFVLPMILGACSALGADSMLYGFGTLAFVAVAPLVTLQIVGLIAKIIENKHKVDEDEVDAVSGKRVEIIEYD